jgi:acetyl esterase/lipase
VVLATLWMVGVMVMVASLTLVFLAAGLAAKTAASSRPTTRHGPQVAAVAAAPLPPRVQTDLRYGPEPQQLLELLLPDPTVYPGPRPVMIYLHSGGWVGGDRTAVNPIPAAEVARGYAVASVEYRLAGNALDGQPIASFPGAIWDVKRAIRFLKANATTNDLNPRHVVLLGASAGGHLAAFVAATKGLFEPPDLDASLSDVDSSVVAVVDIVGPSDLTTFERTKHPWAAGLTASFLGCPTPTPANMAPCPDDLLRTASVETYLDPTDPPIYLAYGQQDTLVVPGAQGAPLAAGWTQAHHGDPSVASYHVIAGAGHNILPAEVQPSLDQWLDARAEHISPPEPSPPTRITRRLPTTSP